MGGRVLIGRRRDDVTGPYSPRGLQCLPCRDAPREALLLPPRVRRTGPAAAAPIPSCPSRPYYRRAAAPLRLCDISCKAAVMSAAESRCLPGASSARPLPKSAAQRGRERERVGGPESAFRSTNDSGEGLAAELRRDLADRSFRWTPRCHPARAGLSGPRASANVGLTRAARCRPLGYSSL